MADANTSSQSFHPASHPGYRAELREVLRLRQGLVASMRMLKSPFWKKARSSPSPTADYLITSEARSPSERNFWSRPPNSSGIGSRIQVHTQCEAISIDRDQRTVVAQNHATGKQVTYAYDRLILATGCRTRLASLFGSRPKIFASLDDG